MQINVNPKLKGLFHKFLLNLFFFFVPEVIAQKICFIKIQVLNSENANMFIVDALLHMGDL